MGEPAGTWDVAIVGGGIVGLATAMAVVSAGRRPVVIEAEARIAEHQTGHNSGVIHSGLYYKPGSLKATNCTEGREALYRFCEEHGVRHERCGKVVVALDETERGMLARLRERGDANGLAGLRLLDAGALREIEPHAAGVEALFVPETGIVDYREVCAASRRVIEDAGGEVRTATRFLARRADNGAVVAETTAGALHGRVLVNCAGLQSDRVARACGVDPGVRIVPFRGEYYTLRPDRRALVRNLIYPVPDPRFPFLGVHLTRMVDGQVEAGPNAVLAFRREGYTFWQASARDLMDLAAFGGFWRLVRRYWATGSREMVRSLSKRAFVAAVQRLVPELRVGDVARGGAGVRAQAVDAHGHLLDDFHVVEAPRMVHVLNAPSPAATASISIGRAIASRALAQLA